MKKMRKVGTTREIKVTEHIILKNGWEYYIIDDKNNTDEIKFAYVMGHDSEFGDVYLPEIMPYAISKTKVTAKSELFPAEGYEWVE